MINGPMVSVVIPTHNRKSKLLRLLASLDASSYPRDRMEIIVVDDASSDQTSDLVPRKFPRVKLIKNESEQWLSAARNIGAKHAKGKYILFVDDDNVIARECIDTLVDFAESNQTIGIAAPLMYYYEDPQRIWFAGSKRNYIFAISIWMWTNQIPRGTLRKPIPSDEFPNAFIVRADVFHQIGGFDEKNFPIHCGETDLCARIREAKYTMFVLPTAHIWHEISREFANEIANRDEKYLYSMAKSEILVSRKNNVTARRIFPFVAALYMFKPLLGVGMHILSSPTKGNARRLFAYLKGTLDGMTSPV